MEDEENDLHENKEWELVELPKGRAEIKPKWIFDIRMYGLENAIINKASLVAKGFSQKEGEDYIEGFSPVSRYSTITFVLDLYVHNSWILERLDMETEFINEQLDDEIFRGTTNGFLNQGI